MELLLKILEGFWTGIKHVISNPVLLLLILFGILVKIFYPKFRGFMGEFWVRTELNKLPQKDYIILNDIMLENERGTHQIDHIVISKYGIFVIEMKNYYGKIIGDEYKSNWLQYLGKNKYYFKNPIHQNYGHIKVLEEILNLDEDFFIPIVCFSNQVSLKISTKNIVIQLDDLLKIIKKFDTIRLDNDINLISNKIKTLNILNKDKRQKHVKDIKEKLHNENTKVDNMICPKCGSKLVERNGKYGIFIGCSSYPKCRYIKNN